MVKWANFTQNRKPLGPAQLITLAKENDIQLFTGRVPCYQQVTKRQGPLVKVYEEGVREVRCITLQQAAPVIQQYEWLGTVPSNSWRNYGLYIEEVLCCVELFVRTKAGGRYTYLGHPAICLSRGASVRGAPAWAGSYLISESLRLLGKELSGPHFVIAYADWEAGELGSIYQACSWIYCGRRKEPHWLSPDGRLYDRNYHRDLAKKIDPDWDCRRKIKPFYPQIMKKLMFHHKWRRTSLHRGTYATVAGGSRRQRAKLRKLLDKRAKPYPKSHDL